MKSDSVSNPTAGGFQARLRAMLDSPYGSIRRLLRRLIPFEHRRRFVRFVRRRFGAAWGESTASRTASLKALQSVLDRTAPQTFDIICLPIIDWDFRFQRPQQLMSQFALAGHRVFYVTQNFRQHGAAYEVSLKGPNLYEVSLFGPDRNIYTDNLNSADVAQLLSSLSALRRDLSLAATVIIVQLPFWRPLAKLARAIFGWPITYDCMDYHAGFSTNRAAMLEEERDLILTADCVLFSSRFLGREVVGDARRTLLLRNACDYDHFAQVGERTPTKPPMIGYYGAIADWFDTDLVADLAERHPEWRFVLVGSTFSANLSRLHRLSNVSMVGEQPYSELPRWLDEIDVLLLPFRRIPLTEATNPVKAYEILAAGKPLISVPIAEMMELAPLVQLASNVSEFEEEITRALIENDSAAIEARRAFAREHTWRKRFEILEPALRETFPLASIIIITFNNLELNQLCLQSLFTNTDWPKFEVIVVDNASTDGTAQFLKEAAEQYRNLRVVFNEENRGFAAANNQGLAAALGQYLVLLNNDTAVPRGWLTALIRHLSCDEAIGIIGPVTNEVGNEAKVAVQYSSLAEMPAWAAEYTREHDDQVFAIPMLAMFCLAMRREVFEQVGPLDERFGMGMFEDDDYARRVAAAGFQVRCTRDSFVHHVGSASFKKLSAVDYFQLFDRNRALYEEKWGELWQPHEDETARGHLPELRMHLREIVAGTRGAALETIVFLPGEGWQGDGGSASANMARALSEEGCLVFLDCSGRQKDQFLGFKQVSPLLFLYRGPVGALEELEQPALWASAHHSSILKRWKRPRIIYNFVPDMQQRFKEGHAQLMRTADIVISEAPLTAEEAKAGRPGLINISREGAGPPLEVTRLLLHQLSSVSSNQAESLEGSRG